MGNITECRKAIKEYFRRIPGASGKGMTHDEFAGAIGYDRPYVTRVLNGKPMSKEFIRRSVEAFAEHKVIKYRSEARYLFELGNIDTSLPLFWDKEPLKGLTDDDTDKHNKPERQRTPEVERKDEKVYAKVAMHKDLTDDDLAQSGSHLTPEMHTLPFPRNPFFTGRDALLKQLGRQLQEHGSVAINQPLSVSGLGGIGKTQLALEYAHRSYQSVYKAVFWVKAVDAPTLQTEYDTLAQLLELPESDEREPERRVQAIKRWLDTYKQWLLILDNADDLYVAKKFLPAKPGGHILVTTRSRIVSALGKARHIEMDKMEPAEGLLFLLKRIGLAQEEADIEAVATDTREAARELVALLDGHPLALDQAGAYIEETGVPIARYIQLYQKARQYLLQRRGLAAAGDDDDHPASVAASVALTFGKACERCAQAADVLSFCSFLQPDAMPEEVLLQADSLKLDTLSLDEAIVALQRYSLVKRNTQDQTLSMHRLVQAVVVDGMAADLSQQWRERVVWALNVTFPEVEFNEWAKCGRLLPHVLVCSAWTESDLAPTLEVAELFNKTGVYLRERGQYAEADMLLVRALAIRQQHLGTEHPALGSILNDLAVLYQHWGKYEQAEPLYQQSLAIREQYLGADHPDTATSLHNLATLYWYQGKYEQAESLYKRALAIREQLLGTEHPDTAKTLNNLALLYWSLGEYEQAEPLYQRALSIYEQHQGKVHPLTAQSLNNLAILYRRMGKYEQAEPLYERALAINEQLLGAEHPRTATSMNNLALLYWQIGKYEQAEPLQKRALAIHERQSGAEHPDTAISLHNLANLYSSQRKYEQAEPLFVRACAIREQRLGANHPDTAASLTNLAILYRRMGKYEQAEPLFWGTLATREQQLGMDHPDTAESLYELAKLLQDQGKHEQAADLYQRALAIREQRLGLTHPDTQATRIEAVRQAYEPFLIAKRIWDRKNDELRGRVGLLSNAFTAKGKQLRESSRKPTNSGAAMINLYRELSQ